MDVAAVCLPVPVTGYRLFRADAFGRGWGKGLRPLARRRWCVVVPLLLP